LPQIACSSEDSTCSMVAYLLQAHTGYYSRTIVVYCVLATAPMGALLESKGQLPYAMY
jgi:hypothetical protein